MKLRMDQDALACFPLMFCWFFSTSQGKESVSGFAASPWPSPPIVYAGSRPFNLWQGRAVQGRKLARSHYLTITMAGARERTENLCSFFFCFLLQGIHILKNLPHIYSTAAGFQVIFLLWATMTISPCFQPHVRFQSRWVPARPGQQASHCIIRQTRVREDTWERLKQPVINNNTDRGTKVALCYTSVALSARDIWILAKNIEIQTVMTGWGSADKKVQSKSTVHFLLPLAGFVCTCLLKNYVKVLPLSLFDTKLASDQDWRC